MSSSSDDVHPMIDESSVPFHTKQGKMSRGLRHPERRVEARRQQHNENEPSSSGEIGFRISSSYTFMPQQYLIKVG
ncbi:unnamed protein product [Protopolystoma xenopodis]|uniref:Uncharacterized protein n=1 Tax=Protopolystoma xenopodis TaxID=117903 RepID=A0A3S5FDA8_9PLAT|nr:unnamed protein product [Protopolystoma xenopodis]